MKKQLFTKRPVIVQAMLHTGDNVQELLEWMGVKGSRAITSTIIIRTLEGEIKCNKGDWLVQGLKGEFYPVRDDIFKLTYDPLI